MATSGFQIYPGAIETLLNGPQSIAQKKTQAHKIKAAWQANIHDITGVTDTSIDVEVRGTDIAVTAESAGSGDNPSAWYWLEYGTSDMPAQHPGRRAIRGR